MTSCLDDSCKTEQDHSGKNEEEGKATITAWVRHVHRCVDYLHWWKLRIITLDDIGYRIRYLFEQIIFYTKNSLEKMSKCSNDTTPTTPTSDEIDQILAYLKHPGTNRWQKLKECDEEYWNFFLKHFKFQDKRFEEWAESISLFELSEASLNLNSEQMNKIDKWMMEILEKLEEGE